MARYKYASLIKELVGEGHLTTDDVYDALRKKWQRVSIATIYRTLEYMLQSSALTQFFLWGAKTYYEKNKGIHAHLIDQERNIIMDVSLPLENIKFPSAFHPQNSAVNFFWSREWDIPPESFNLFHSISYTETTWEVDKKKDKSPQSPEKPLWKSGLRSVFQNF